MSHSTNEKIKYFLYARKSSDSEDRQVQSIDDQIKCLKDLAARLNLEIKEIFTESKSAKRPYFRPVFAKMVKRIEKGEAAGILCWKLDRLARNPVDAGAITWMLQNSIVRHIKAYDGNFYPTDNVLLLAVEFGIANQYIIDLKKNCRRGMEGRAERGWLPALPPAGYLNDKNEHTIAVDKERFAMIRKMWDLLLSGSYNPQQIREIANTEWGYRTRQFKRQGGAPLANSTIYKIFTNIFYTGMFEWGGKLYNGKHTPMITLEEYDRAQAILGKNGRPRPKNHEFAYTGLISCGHCACMITGTEKEKFVKKTSTRKTYVYYHCTKKKKQSGCTQKPVTLAALEKQILWYLKRIEISQPFFDLAKAEIHRQYANEAAEAQKIQAVREQGLAKTENELANLTKMRYRDLIDDQTFVSERDSLQVQITRLKHELTHNTSHVIHYMELTEQAFGFALKAKEKFKTGTLKEKKEILTTLGSNFFLQDKKLLIEAVEWVKVLEQSLQPLRAEFQRLELKLSPYFSRQDAEIQPFILHLRTLVEEVRTALSINTESSKDIPP